MTMLVRHYTCHDKCADRSTCFELCVLNLNVHDTHGNVKLIVYERKEHVHGLAPFSRSLTSMRTFPKRLSPQFFGSCLRSSCMAIPIPDSLL